MSTRQSAAPSETTTQTHLSKAQLRAFSQGERVSLLAEYSELSGVPVEDLLNEALDDFISCCLEARTQMLREAAKKRAVDEYLIKLEAEMDS